MPIDISLLEAPTKCSNLCWTQILLGNCAQQILHLLFFVLLDLPVLIPGYSSYKILLLHLLYRKQIFSRRAMSMDYFGTLSIGLS